MPGFNQRGPANQGPMTGRGMGMCANGTKADSPNFSNPAGRGLGLGFRRGRGMGQGRGMGFFRGQGAGYGQAPIAGQNPNAMGRNTMPANSMEDLKLRAEMLESELNSVRESIVSLSNSSDTQ